MGTKDGVVILRRHGSCMMNTPSWSDWPLEVKMRMETDCLDFHPTGNYFIAAGPQVAGFLLHDISAETFRHVRCAFERVTDLSYSPCGSLVMTGDSSIYSSSLN